MPTLGTPVPLNHPLCALDDLPAGYLALIECGCGHVATAPARRLIKRHGENKTLAMVMMRFTCTSCGRRGAIPTIARICTGTCIAPPTPTPDPQPAR